MIPSWLLTYNALSLLMAKRVVSFATVGIGELGFATNEVA